MKNFVNRTFVKWVPLVLIILFFIIVAIANK